MENCALYLFERETHRGKACVPVQWDAACKGWAWARQKPKSRNKIQISKLGRKPIATTSQGLYWQGA